MYLCLLSFMLQLTESNLFIQVTQMKGKITLKWNRDGEIVMLAAATPNDPSSAGTHILGETFLTTCASTHITLSSYTKVLLTTSSRNQTKEHYFWSQVVQILKRLREKNQSLESREIGEKTIFGGLRQFSAKTKESLKLSHSPASAS